MLYVLVLIVSGQYYSSMVTLPRAYATKDDCEVAGKLFATQATKHPMFGNYACVPRL